MLEEAGLPELGALVDYEPGVAQSPAAPVARGRVASVRPSNHAHAAAERSSDGEYDFVGIVMAKSAEGNAVAQILSRRQDVEVIEQPSFWDIRGEHRLVISYAQASEELGYDIDAYSIQHEMSTHYGRMVATDESLMLFADPIEAMEHLRS